MTRPLTIALTLVLVVAVIIGIVVVSSPAPAPKVEPSAGEPSAGDPSSLEPLPEPPPAIDLPERLDEPPEVRGLDQTDPLIREAVGDAMQRVRLNPDAAWAWHDLGEVCHANAFNDVAIVCYQQALIRDPGRARSAYLLALLEQRRGRTDLAIDLIEYVDAQTSFAPAHWRAGRWLLDVGDIDAAEVQFERALAIDPGDDAAHFGMVRVHLMRRQPQDAIGVLTDDLAETPNLAYRDQLLASAYRRAGEPEKAAAVAAGAARGLPVWPDPWLQDVEDQKTGFVGEMERASRLIERNMHREAIDLLERVRVHFPQRETLLINLALAESNLGRRDRAEQILREIIEFDPQSHLAWQNLGAMLVMKAVATESAPDEAFACLDRAIEIDPFDTRSRMLRGDYYAATDREDEAIDMYRRALEVDPRHILAHDKIGTIYALRGDLERAVVEFERIVAIDPLAAPIWVRIATIYVRLGEPDPAQHALNEATRRVPRTNPQIRQIQQRINQLVAGDG